MNKYQAKRALLFAGILGAIALAGYSSGAKAQDAGPLAFVQSQATSSAPARGTRVLKPRGARVTETGRRVHVQLPPPPPFIRGRLVCAKNVNQYLAKMGKPTTGSALAFSFLSLPRAADRYTPGAVQISRRRGGGHAEIVAGGGMCWNPSSSGQRWALVSCYARRNVVGWRTA